MFRFALSHESDAMNSHVPSSSGQPISTTSSSTSFIRDDEDKRHHNNVGGDHQRPTESLIEYWTRREKEAAERALREDHYLQQRRKTLQKQHSSQSKIVLPEEISIPDNSGTRSSNTAAEDANKRRSSTTTTSAYSLPPEATAMHDFLFRDEDTTTIDEHLSTTEDKEKETPTPRDSAYAAIIRNQSYDVSQFSSEESEIHFGDDDEPSLDGPIYLNLHMDLENCSWSLLDQHLVHLSKRPDLILRTMLQIDPSHGNATPLHTACWKAPPLLALHMISLLPRIGPHMEHVCLVLDVDGNTALHLCAANICQDFQHNRIRGATTSSNNDNRYQDFVEKGSSVNNDEEIVCYPSIPGFRGEDVIEALVLSAPQALIIQNNEGDTPLHLAVSSSFSTSYAVSILAKEGSSKACFLQDCTGACPLHAAIANNVKDDVLAVLLEAAPEVARIADNQGLLPLHYVAAFCHTPVAFVQRLIKAYPDAIFSQTVDGDTPLHLAISNCKSEDELTISTVELLLGNYSVDDCRNPIFIANKEKLTPISCCAEFNAPAMVKELIVQYCTYHGCDGEVASDVATSQRDNENDDNNNDEQQYWESAASSLSKINSGSHVQTGAKIDSHSGRHSTTQQENASGANFYLSGIANVKTPQTTVDRIECLSKLFSYNGSRPLAKERLSTQFMSSQVNSLAKSLALPIFASKN